jgi:hypothetical protein
MSGKVPGTKPGTKLPEPWLRGVLPGVHPVTGHLLRASQQIREDAGQSLLTLTPAQLWATPHGMTSAGFHAKHLAGSTQRLCTYLEGGQLTAQEVAEVALEGSGSDSPAELISAIEAALDRYDQLVTQLAPGDFGGVREIGRQRIPTTAVGLAIHIAEHGQRHTGQLICAARLAQRTNA